MTTSPTRAVPLFLLALLAGCTTAQVRLPAGLGDEPDIHVVTGISPWRTGQPVVFGPYSARRLQDGGRYADEATVGRAGFWRQWHPWRYALTTAGESVVEVECEASRMALSWGKAGSSLEVDLMGLEGSMLGCALRRGRGAPPDTLEMSRSGNRLAGRLATAARVYEVASLHGFEGSRLQSGDPVGFEFTHQGRVLMVVDVLNQGRVLFPPGSDPRERTLLAAAATALLTAGALDPSL